MADDDETPKKGKSESDRDDRVTEPVGDGFRAQSDADADDADADDTEADEVEDDAAEATETGEPLVEEDPEGADDLELLEAQDADVEFTDEDVALLAEAERDLVAEYRERAARAEAELKNFRTRVERDRAANREVVIAEVIRSLLPAIDDLDRADAHGDLVEGSPLALIAQKIRAGFEKYGLAKVGEKGERFDPKLHEAIVRIPSSDVTFDTVADVIEPGYLLGERLIRAAKVAVSSPE
jgi:molecular chaperone GrpE